MKDFIFESDNMDSLPIKEKSFASIDSILEFHVIRHLDIIKANNKKQNNKPRFLLMSLSLMTIAQQIMHLFSIKPDYFTTCPKSYVSTI